MNKKQLEYIKKVHDELLAGTYDPERLTKAYLMIEPDADLMFILPRQKKQRVMSFMTYQYPELIKVETKEKFTDPFNAPADEVVSPKPVIDTHIVTEKPEEVKMEKPTATKKKRVYKRKKNA